MNQAFIDLVSSTGGKEVESIINAMFHTRKENARRFLIWINSIVDHYIAKDGGQGKVCYPIIHVPQAPEWAREVLLKYLILKLSLYYNDDTRIRLSKRIHSVMDLDEKGRVKGIGKSDKKYETPFRQYVRQALLPNLADCTLGIEGHKNLIFCRPQDITVSRSDKNLFIEEFYGPVDDVFSDRNLCVCNNITSKDIRRALRQDRERDLKIDNIFVFYTNNESCNSLEDSALLRLNESYHIGIKNCFVFDFSSQPYSLRNVLRRCNTLNRRFPMLPEKMALENTDFNTLTAEETEYIFTSSRNYEHLYLSDDQLFFTDAIGVVLNEMENKIQERNKFSCCLTPTIADEYEAYLSSICQEYDKEFYQLSFEYQDSIASNKIIPIIRRFIDEEKYAAFVIDRNVPPCTQREIQRIIGPETKISFYDYSALKERRINPIKEKRIVLMVYRPHYVNTPYSKYPNSFDAFYLNDGQQLLEIIQGHPFANMYSWDKYDYDYIQYKLVKSEYRQMVLGGYSAPQKPVTSREFGESEFDDERVSTRSIPSVRIVCTDGYRFTIPETTYVICEIEDAIEIAKLSDLMVDETLKPGLKIQRLDEIEDLLSSFMDEKVKEADDAEKRIREIYYNRGEISKEDRDSDIALWRILLKKRIQEGSAEEIYHTIMSGIKKEDQISLFSFKKWTDYSISIILPLQKLSQRALFNYLGFDNTPYLSIMRRKKAAIKNGTRRSNDMMDKFLCSTLASPITDDLFREIKDSSINEILQLQDTGDLSALIEILSENIKLKEINTIN